MLEVYGRPGGAVNKHEEPQTSALEESFGYFAFLTAVGLPGMLFVFSG